MAETLAENRDSLPKLPPLPLRMDANKVFRQHVTIEGCISLPTLQRLAGYLADEQGTVVVKLTFDKDEAGHRRIHGSVQAQVNVVCQRCLEPMALRLEEPLCLALVSSEAMARELPDNMDPWLMTPDNDELLTSDIIEDQLILAMPVVSRHQQCSAGSPAQQKLDELQKAADTVSDAGTQNPFAVLARLKSDPPHKPD